MPLTGKRVAILVADGVEDLEYFVPLMRLEEEGAEVVSVGIDKRPVRGKSGLEIQPSESIDSMKSDNYFSVVLPGGWAPDKLRRYSAVTNFVQEMDRVNKTIGIICHGGLIAISADIVRGRPATGSLGIKDDLINAGASWVDSAAFVDRNLVWGRVVADIPAFCRELVATLRQAARNGM